MPLEGFAAPSPEVRPYLVSIGRLYEDLEFESALEQLATARRLSRGLEDDVALSLWEGIIRAEMSRTEQAAAAFKSALFLQPEARLPVKVSPKLARQFESLRQDVKRSLAKGEPAPAATPADAPREEPAKPALAQAPPPDAPVSASKPSVNMVTRAGAPLPLTPEQHSEPSLRSRAHWPAIVGGALAVAGGVSWALSRGELSKLRNADASLNTSEAIDRSVSRGRTLQTAGVGLVGAGVLGLGVAAGMYLLGAPTGRVSVSMGADGSSAMVSGRLP
ncbi:hypothetical protein JY651_29055 [Pyxidicoccus parkwayensis]|uniref:Tetratricopeptide repeat protein n=1 Tax=Pyxidicoccus parkwayensis TaxID=2813578 RepID=A0ABX7NKL5_9BACT|nr:hypothetical protein [Pyxidicoccus parkwaysis]QSQ19376.1 hypothetical protein JY651_29055 [Pyxidicoccus parkwaysis]